MYIVENSKPINKDELYTLECMITAVPFFTIRPNTEYFTGEHNNYNYVMGLIGILLNSSKLLSLHDAVYALFKIRWNQDPHVFEQSDILRAENAFRKLNTVNYMPINPTEYLMLLVGLGFCNVFYNNGLLKTFIDIYHEDLHVAIHGSLAIGSNPMTSTFNLREAMDDYRLLAFNPMWDF